MFLLHEDLIVIHDMWFYCVMYINSIKLLYINKCYYHYYH